MRLNKRMADLGLCSRREADDWIDRGWVLVNGMPAQMGQKVNPVDAITVDPKAHGRQAAQVTVLINKPIAYVSGQAEDGHTPAVTLVQARNRWTQDKAGFSFSPQQLVGLAPAGRLDIDSTGLLVLTQDGRIARGLIGADSQVEKEYLVRVCPQQPPGTRARLSLPGAPSSTGDLDVQSSFDPSKLALLRHGLSLDGQSLKRAQVDWQNPQQLRFVLTEGRKRQIRRMCELVGLQVLGLKRVRIGKVMLGNLPLGQWRYLGAHESFW